MSKPHKKHVPYKLFFLIAAVGVVMVVGMATSVNLKSLHDQANRLPGGLVFAMMAVLPVLGVPASVLYAVGGAKFGNVWGLALVALAIALHLVGSWWIGHSWLRRPIDWLFHKTGYHKPQVPEGEYVPFCLLIALIPGVPYALKNYLMILGGVPFRPFFWTCLPAHFVSATLGIFFGDFTSGMTPARITFLVVYALFLTGMSRYVVGRLRKRAALRDAIPAKDQADAESTSSETR